MDERQTNLELAQQLHRVVPLRRKSDHELEAHVKPEIKPKRHITQHPLYFLAIWLLIAFLAVVGFIAIAQAEMTWEASNYGVSK